jgi:hypothetical protein
VMLSSRHSMLPSTRVQRSGSVCVDVSVVQRSLGLIIETYRSGSEGHADEHEEVDEEKHDSEVLDGELHGRCV